MAAAPRARSRVSASIGWPSPVPPGPGKSARTAAGCEGAEATAQQVTAAVGMRAAAGWRCSRRTRLPRARAASWSRREAAISHGPGRPISPMRTAMLPIASSSTASVSRSWPVRARSSRAGCSPMRARPGANRSRTGPAHSVSPPAAAANRAARAVAGACASGAPAAPVGRISCSAWAASPPPSRESNSASPVGTGDAGSGASGRAACAALPASAIACRSAASAARRRAASGPVRGRLGAGRESMFIFCSYPCRPSQVCAGRAGSVRPGSVRAGVAVARAAPSCLLPRGAVALEPGPLRAGLLRPLRPAIPAPRPAARPQVSEAKRSTLSVGPETMSRSDM